MWASPALQGEDTVQRPALSLSPTVTDTHPTQTSPRQFGNAPNTAMSAGMGPPGALGQLLPCLPRCPHPAPGRSWYPIFACAAAEPPSGEKRPELSGWVLCWGRLSGGRGLRHLAPLLHTARGPQGFGAPTLSLTQPLTPCDPQGQTVWLQRDLAPPASPNTWQVASEARPVSAEAFPGPRRP